MKKNLSVKTFIFGLVIFLIIICTSSIPGYLINITKIELFLCFLGVFFLLANKKYSSDDIIIFLMMLLFVSIIQFLIYPDNILHWLRFCLLLIVMVHFSIFAINNKVNLIKIYYYLFLYMCFISTSMYVAVEILKMPIPSFLFSNDWMMEQRSYFFVYNCRLNPLHENIFGLEMTRNCGFFSEPGLYSFFIICSLFIYIYVKNNKSTPELIILLFSLFTTFSTTGFILLIIMGAYYINSRRKTHLYVKALLLVLTLIAGTMLINDILMIKQEEHAFSYSARTYDLIGGIQLFLQSPVWGWGYKNTDIFHDFSLKGFGDERTSSNGVVSALYQLGIIGCAVFYVPLVRIKKHFKSNKKIYYLFLLILIASIMGEPIQYMASGLAIFGFIIAVCAAKTNVLIRF